MNLQENISRIKELMLEQSGSVIVPPLAISAIQAIESVYCFMRNGKIMGGNYTGKEKLGIFSQYINDTIGGQCWGNMDDKFKGQIYSFCFQADSSSPYKLKFVAGLAYAMDNSIDRGKIVNKTLNDVNVQNAIKLIKSNCGNINSYYDKYLQVVDQQYKSMDYDDNYSNIWKYRPKAIDQIMSGVDIKTALNNWKNSLGGIQDTTNTNDNNTTNQSSTYTVGQVLTAKRDIDNQRYSIKIEQVGDGWVSAFISGPGEYDDKPLKNTKLELYTRNEGKLSGNSQLGEFTIVK